MVAPTMSKKIPCLTKHIKQKSKHNQTVVLVSLKVNCKVKLLEFNLCASLFELSLESFSVSSWNCFLNSLRSVINDFLSFLKAKTCCFTNSLDNLNLVCAYFCKYYVKLCLFVSCCCATLCRCCYCYCCCSAYAEFFFYCSYEL